MKKKEVRNVIKKGLTSMYVIDNGIVDKIADNVMKLFTKAILWTEYKDMIDRYEERGLELHKATHLWKSAKDSMPKVGKRVIFRVANYNHVGIMTWEETIGWIWRSDGDIPFIAKIHGDHRWCEFPKDSEIIPET